MKILYRSLSDDQKRSVAKRLVQRKHNYLKLLRDEAAPGKILIVGDRPGPSAPVEEGYHHTPFYSTKHCSGWLNANLEVEGVNEDDLIWINAYDRLGNPSAADLIDRARPRVVIALGGNAHKWCLMSGLPHHEAYKYVKVPHPQWHKRFMSEHPYELIEVLKCCHMIKLIGKCSRNICPLSR